MVRCPAALVFFCLINFFSFGQHLTSHEIKNYSPLQFQSHNQNWDIVQDNRGILFFANGDGILEFDGLNWRKILITRHTSVLSLAINDHGRVYAGGIGEFGYLDPDAIGNLKYQSLSDRLPDSLQNTFNNIWKTFCIGDKIFFQGDKICFVYHNDTLGHFRVNQSISAAYSVLDEFWYHVLGKGIYAFRNNKAELLKGSEFYSEKPIISVFPFDSVHHLVISGVQGIYLYNIHTGENNPFKPGINKLLKDQKVLSATRLKNNDYAIGAMPLGLIIFSPDGEIKNAYSFEDGLYSGNINFIYEDREGLVWCVSDKGITKIYYGLPITTLKEGDGFKGIINTVIKHNGNMYLGTNEGVFKLKNKDIFNQEKSKYKKIPEINSQCFDLESCNGKIIATTTEGTIEINDKDEVEKIKHFYSRAISVINDSPETILIGGRNEVRAFKKDAGKWKEILHIDKFPDEVLHIEQDDEVKDSLVFWLGLFSNGVARLSLDKNFSNFSYQVFSTNAGFEEGYVVPNKVNNKLMFITKFKQVYEYDRANGVFFNDTLISPILNVESSYLLKSDSHQNIYVEASGPIYFLRKTENGYKADRRSLSNLGAGYINDIFIDEDDKAWLGCETALIRFDPEMEANHDFTYYTHIRKVVSGKDSVLFAGYFHENGKLSLNQVPSFIKRLPYKQNDISFFFSAPFFQENEKLLFSYKLEGYNEDFTEWTNETKATYTNLFEGEYIFKVKAKNIYGNESTVAEYKFSISAPWFRTPLAYGGYGLSVLGIIYFLIVLNAKRLKAANIRLQNIIHEKTAEIVGQRDVLQQQKEEMEIQKEALQLKNTEITDSILYARRIQRALLPAEEKVSTNLPDHFVLFRPKDIVSGDFYWAKENKPENLWYVAAADCTGHGVPGAFLTMLGNSFLNEILSSGAPLTPAQVLNPLREKFIHELGQTGRTGENKDGMDVSLIRLNLKTLELQWSGANNPLWIINPNRSHWPEKAVFFGDDMEGIEIKPDKQPIGYTDNPLPFTNHSVQLKKGDLIYIFTDGYADQFGGQKGKKFKSRSLKKLLLSIQHLSLNEQKKKLEENFEKWKGDLEQVDDVCIIGVRI
jgi:serine phosphatase RsbU (regulator of sigma subunit)/hemin uptake protein HemP